MILLPAKDETLVLPYNHVAVYNKLSKNIDTTGNEPMKVFYGWLKNDRFRITERVKKPDNFVPLISGKIESTSKGSIIFLKYRLMFSTKMFLIFWSILLLLLSAFFAFKYESYFYAAVAIVIGVLNYLIVYLNFKKKVKISHELLIKVLQ